MDYTENDVIPIDADIEDVRRFYRKYYPASRDRQDILAWASKNEKVLSWLATIEE